LKPRFVAERVEDSKISEELKRRFSGKWVVYEPFAGEAVIYDYYESEEEAKKEAELLNMAEKVIEDIRDAAERILEKLSSEEITFLRRYTEGYIEIEI
jgi:DNA-binding transcriptional regulator GbsR (MarR family)